MRIRWRDLELPFKVVCDQESLTPKFGRFSCEPFERGFGVTVGNSLRRVLLSSLEGSAVTKMKLRGAALEFTSLDGVEQDVTDIALNVKSLVVRSHDDRPHVIRIDKEGPCLVTAADIVADPQVEIINPDLVIANVTANVPFELEMIVQNGRGYVPADVSLADRDRADEVGYIPLDASFSPVVNVMFNISETRVGQKTNYERLNMEITTDGSVDPEMALVEAAKILRKHLNPFIQYDRPDGAVFSRPKTATGEGIDPALEQKLATPLSELKLSARAMNCLENENVSTVGQLVVLNEDQLLELRNFGETSLKEVNHKLNEIGLRLGMRVPQTSAVPPLGKFN